MKWIAMLAAGLAIGLGACIQSGATTCTDGTICAEGKQCAAAMAGSATIQICIDPAQLEPCMGFHDFDTCTYKGLDGTCHGGACVPNSCGNLLVDHGEQCDDGNNLSADGCSGDCTSNETCGNGVTDSLQGEECDDGDQLNHDGCSSSCKSEAALWQTFDPMPPRVHAGMAYDPRRHRTVVFGGFVPGTSTLLNDTWEWDGRRWRRIPSPIAPVAREHHTLVYDAARKQIVMFGALRDTWTYDEHGWTLHYPAHSPSVRLGAAMVYDGKHQRVVMHGGTDPSSDGTIAYPDTWAWDGTDWSTISMTGPSARSNQAMAFDPRRGVVVMFGGSDPTTIALADLWELDGATWTKITPTGMAPAGRYEAAMAWDPTHQQVVMVGGRLASATPLKEVWEWDGTHWTALAAVPFGTGSDFFQHTMTTDTARGRVVMLGRAMDTYEFDGGTWTAALVGTTPLGRYDFAFAVDPRHDQTVMFGGVTTPGTVGETWLFDGVWTQLPLAQAHPSARFGTAMVYDPIRDEVILFGGCAPGNIRNAETWAFRHRGTMAPSWTLLAPGTAPSPRCHHSMTWDGARGKIVLVDGEVATGLSAETWSWNGQTWMPEPTATTPMARTTALLGFDPALQRVSLFGGGDGGGEVYYDDTWTWGSAGWVRLDTPNPPAPRGESAIARDPAIGKLVLFGGLGPFGTYYSDAFTLDQYDWHQVPAQLPPAIRSKAGVVTAPDGAGILVFGGTAGGTPLIDMHRLRLDAVAGDEETCTEVDTDGDGLAGCADHDCDYACAPLCPLGEPNCMMGPHCGDGICDASLESCDLCPDDCGACIPVCGDATCNAGETSATCPGDCPP